MEWRQPIYSLSVHIDYPLVCSELVKSVSQPICDKN